MRGNVIIYCESDCKWSIDGECKKDSITMDQYADYRPECEDYEVVEPWE